MNPRRSGPVFLVPFAAASLALSGCAKPKAPVVETYVPWNKEIIELFRGMPVLEGGRVKPMDAVARVRLLSYYGRRSMEFDVGKGPDDAETVEISAAEWLLDVLFRPEIAKRQPVFLVNDSDAVTAIGVSSHEKRRSRYTHGELAVGRAKLAELREKYGAMEPEDRGGRENQIFDLGSNVSEFEFMAGLFDFARDGMAVSAAELARAGVRDLGDIEGTESVRVTDFPIVVEKVKAVREQEPGEDDAAYAARSTALEEALTEGSQQIGFYLNVARAFTLTPPQSKDTAEWLTPAELLDRVVDASLVVDAGSVEWELGWLREFEDLARAEPNSDVFRDTLANLRKTLDEATSARGEGARIGTELAL